MGERGREGVISGGKGRGKGSGEGCRVWLGGEGAMGGGRGAYGGEGDLKASLKFVVFHENPVDSNGLSMLVLQASLRWGNKLYIPRPHYGPLAANKAPVYYFDFCTINSVP